MMTFTARRRKLERAHKHLEAALALLDEVHADHKVAATYGRAASDSWGHVVAAAGRAEAARDAVAEAIA